MDHGSDRNRFAARLFSGLPERYDVLAELLSFGQNRRWRAAMVDRVAGCALQRVADVATGTAGVARLLARRTGAAVVGVDLTEAMLRRGAANLAGAEERPLVALVAGRAEALPFPDEAFDALCFTYLLRYVDDPPAVLQELARVVRPGGTVASLEFHVPDGRLVRSLWWLYTRVALPVAGGLLGGRPWWDVGRFLGPSISEHGRHWPLARLADAWRQAGFEDVGARVMSLGGGLVMWGTRARR
jgi:demethylmenaquinone methyltransferase/2-methoxy-6-polyprenyl-1,4-benzoquinol methylase